MARVSVIFGRAGILGNSLGNGLEPMFFEFVSKTAFRKYI
jgi:hypothetical protein